MTIYWTLDARGEPTPCDDVCDWANRCSDTERQIADTQVGDVQISTIFLGINHNFGSGPPVLFETMLFGGSHDGLQERYSTRAEALVGHAKWVALVEAMDTRVAKLLDLINRWRSRRGERPLDPKAAGWSMQDIMLEAERIAGKDGVPR